jgi:gluconate 2-dehydrogenase gamma chain
MTEPEKSSPRRTFLMKVASVAGTSSFAASRAVNATTPPLAPPSDTASLPPYLSLSPDEATFVEALVNVMCPADEYSPTGVDCGLATYIDRQLAGSFGKGAGRYQRGPFRTGKRELGLQLPLTPEEIFKAGIAGANAACIRDRGKPFAQLVPGDADEFLKALSTNRVTTDGVSLELWFDEIVYPLFVEACFADPMYGGNRNAVLWKMLGYPGLPATHNIDMVQYRGKPYPGAKNPKSIVDFT